MPFPSKRLTNSERIFIQKYSIKLRKEKYPMLTGTDYKSWKGHFHSSPKR